MNFHDGRFRTDPTFGMIVNNQLNRRNALTIGNIIARDLGDMTVAELKAAVAKNDAGVMEKLQYYSKNIDGSPQYFYNQRKKMKVLFQMSILISTNNGCSNNSYIFVTILQALNRHLLYRSGGKESMTIFQTFSPADMHWDGFHRLLPEEDTKAYLGKIIVDKPTDIPDGANEDNYITKSQDIQLRSRNVNKHSLLDLD